MNIDPITAPTLTGGSRSTPRRPGVAFVHGALHDHSVWILQSRYLAHHGHAVLAVDLPAHGRSGGAPLGCRPRPPGWPAWSRPAGCAAPRWWATAWAH